MRSRIRALYSNPIEKVWVNGHLPDAFNLRNKTRQGCPLFPLLFVLTLEPLLNRIRQNLDIKDIEIQNQTYKLAAFADDMLVFLSHPHISLPNLIQDLEHFHSLSNLKINHSKSNALNISLAQDLVKLCQKNFPFTWSKDAITNLGIQISTHMPDLFNLNYILILKEAYNDLKFSKCILIWQSIFDQDDNSTMAPLCHANNSTNNSNTKLFFYLLSPCMFNLHMERQASQNQTYSLKFTKF